MCLSCSKIISCQLQPQWWTFVGNIVLHIFFTVSMANIFSSIRTEDILSRLKLVFSSSPLCQWKKSGVWNRAGGLGAEAAQQHIKIQTFLLCKQPQTVFTKKQDLSKSPESLAENEILSRCQIKSCDHHPISATLYLPLTVVGLIFLSVMIIPAYKILIWLWNPKNENQPESLRFVWTEFEKKKEKYCCGGLAGLDYCWLNVKVRTQKITNSPIIIVL